MAYQNVINFRILFLISIVMIATSCNKVKFTDQDLANAAALEQNPNGNGNTGNDGSNPDSDAPENTDNSNNTNTVDYPNSNQPANTPVVQDACANLPHKKLNTAYQFPKPSQTCSWSTNGNLARRDSYFQARIEQEKSLSLESGAVICDVKFKFNQQQFLYDDHFLMTFNNAVIASSYNFENQLSLNYGLLRYDWNQIAGMYWARPPEGVYCAANAACSWPVTDTPGYISMNFPAELFQRLMAEDLNRNTHSMKFISIGDNDEYDCEHSDVNFTLEVDYVVR